MKNIVTWRPVFTSILLAEDELMVPTLFNITLIMEIVSDDFDQQDIALERIQTVVESFFQGSVICEMNQFASEIPYSFSNNVVAVPADPTDHMLCGLLFTKCNAVAEGRIVMQEVRIQSSRGSGIEYSINAAHGLPSFLVSDPSGVQPWFLRNDISFTDSFQLDNKDIIHFPIEYCSWTELEMNWDRASENATESTASIVSGSNVIDFKSIRPVE